MLTKGKVQGGDTIKKNCSLTSVLIVVGLCGFFYVVGLWQRSGFGKGDRIAIGVIKRTECITLSDLMYDTPNNHNDGDHIKEYNYKPCDASFIDHTPCHRRSGESQERHCPAQQEKLKCLIPAPKGYATPYQWPKNRGGTRFPQELDAYIDELSSVIPFHTGMIRTALDTECRVASFGAYMFKKNVITMSIGGHESQVQYAMERGIPAIIGVLATMKLPFPSGSFDMAHCSHCLIPWDTEDGMYMMEVDRVLRPGGYWILSGPPINWKNNYQEWQRSQLELEKEQRNIEDIAKLLCWEKKYEKGDIAIWRKRLNCSQQDTPPTAAAVCKSTHADHVWYKKMEKCVTPSPGPSRSWKPFPERLNAIPSRVSREYVEVYKEDSRLWKKHVNAYKRVNKIIDSGRYRNIMDMNAGLGSFAAALDSTKLWVMNVVPTISQKASLDVILERGLIGIYHDWCEAFSTYPRTYDLIHANGVFSLYKNVCSAEEMLLEMDRILRPEGAVILRDEENVLRKVQRIVRGMRWKTKMVDHEDGPLEQEKLLFAVKQYWVEGDTNITTT
ncbi:hypothetical protein HN51_003280 [Arachis hypogaea]|uniref:Methyltransferase n=1 Tax=Arachis hypogaea TaxID=3818 RepID=A0A445EJL9_ARAHY|nr:probable methyltransferase PMT2 [Arachis hypogaea]QHO51640.1 putative methyltransferase [Arachis hypogaea]RYR75533.1 hypothetical protein Ahy_A01g000079 [Arachis hypogaea]